MIITAYTSTITVNTNISAKPALDETGCVLESVVCCTGGVAVGVGKDAPLGALLKVGLRLPTCKPLGAPRVGHGSAKPCP